MTFDLKKIGSLCGGLVSIVILIGIVLTGWSELQAMKAATAEAMEVATTAMILIEGEKELNEKRDVILAQLADQVNNIYKRGLIVQGRALVLDVGDKPYVELNSRDPNGPSRLAEFDHLHITNLTHPDLIKAEDVQIGPSFSNATQGYVMNLSKAAGALLHAQPGTWIEVRAVPHFEEK